MKFIIRESKIKNLLYKQLDKMELTPQIVECIGGTGCIDLNDKFGVTMFRIDMKNNCFYNGEALHDYTEHFDLPIDEFTLMLKNYVEEKFGYRIKKMH